MTDVPSIAARAGFDLLWDDLASDVRESIRFGFDHGAVFPRGRRPIEVFRHALGQAICDIEGHPRGELVQRLVRDGPYEGKDSFPASMTGKRLTDAETADVVSFVHGHMVNCFQGALAELLAVRPCQLLLSQLVRAKRAPPATRLYVGDSVLASRGRGLGPAKAADFHLLACGRRGAGQVTVVGVGEVKSHRRGVSAAVGQVGGHERRARRGLSIEGTSCPPEKLVLGVGGRFPVALLRPALLKGRRRGPGRGEGDDRRRRIGVPHLQRGRARQ